MKPKLMKVAWVRCNDAMPGEGRLQCPCGNAPVTKFDPSQGDVICNCGRRYSWDGTVKGRSAGSGALTAYRVIFKDGTYSATSMAVEVDLQMALNYFVGLSWLLASSVWIFEVKPHAYISEIAH